MSTFFYCILDFVTASPMSRFLIVPVPAYALCLLWRTFCFQNRGDY